MLIAGIDPGTMSAFCLLDLEGNVVSIGSFKNQPYSKLISAITMYGKVVFVGSDVYPAPNVTFKIASRIGAKVIAPDHNLKYLEKIKLVDSFLKTKKEFIKISNKHEKDALASALYGLRRLNGLIKKIEAKLRQENKDYLISKVMEKVLIEDVPITTALDLLS